VAEDAGDIEAFYAQLPPPSPASEAALLVIQADGKGVPMVRSAPVTPKVRLGKGEKPNRKKEAVVTGLYTIAPHPRTPVEVVASLFHAEYHPMSTTSQRMNPQNKRLWATMAGKDAALERLAKQVVSREGAHIQHRVAFTDGAEALQERVRQHFPTFTLVLDFIHADEKLWDVANCLFGETSPLRTPWVATETLHLLSGLVPQVIIELRRLASLTAATTTQKTVLTQVANYFERNTAFMHYDQYLTNGWPIASGVIEGACRHLVKDRCELSGMRWTKDGVESLLRLRAVAENNDWAAYRIYCQKQRHLRLYNVPWPAQDVLEDQAITVPIPLLPAQHTFIMPTIVAQRTPRHQKPAA
jgi:hypothetical protein